MQVTLARFAGDVDKCLEFLLDTEEGHFFGFDWAVVDPLGTIQGQLKCFFGGKRIMIFLMHFDFCGTCTCYIHVHTQFT